MASPVQVGSMTFTKPSVTQLMATRFLDAPRDLVWKAHTRCEYVQKWLLGPEDWTMPICEIDARPGGKYRYVYEGADGRGFRMAGEFSEVLAPERIVNTERMDDLPAETLNATTLTVKDGGTLIETIVDYPSEKIREEILATGMLDGWAESYDRLERLLRSDNLPL